MSKHARLESTITKTLTKILREEVKSPDVGFVSVTAVRLTNDLSYLTIYYRVLDEATRERTHHALERSKSFIRVTLGKHVKMRKMPQLIFKYDVSLDVGNRIESGLKKVIDEEK